MYILTNGTSVVEYPKIFSQLINNVKQDKRVNCLHNSCTQCNGTGIKKTDNSFCVHGVACSCNSCTLYC